MAKTLYNPKDNLYTPDEVLKYRTPSIADEYFPKVSNQGESKYDGYLTRYDLTTPNAIQEKRAEGQGILDEVGNMLNQAIIGELIGGTIMSFGALIDPKAGIDMIAGNGNDVNNAIFQIGKSISDWTREKTPIYTDPYAEGMERFGNSSYWMSMLPSVVSAVSMMIPGKAVASLVGLATKAVRMGALPAEIINTFMGATAMRHAENYRESNSIYESAYKTAIDQGIEPPEAKRIAASAASTDYRMNSANLMFDMLQLGSISKSFKNALKTGSSLEKSALMAEAGLIKPVTKTSRILSHGRAGLAQTSEGVEEVVNQVSQYEAERQANIESGAIKDDGSNFMDRMQTYMGKADTWDSFIWGVIGGVAFQQIGDAISGSEVSNTIEAKRNAIIATKENFKQYSKAAKEAVENGDDSGYEAIKNNIAVQMVAQHAANGTLDIFSEWVNHKNLQSEMEKYGMDTSDIDSMKKKMNDYIEFAEREVVDLSKVYNSNRDLANELLLLRFKQKNAQNDINHANSRKSKDAEELMKHDQTLMNSIGTSGLDLVNKIARRDVLREGIKEEKELLEEFENTGEGDKEVTNLRTKDEVIKGIEEMTKELSIIENSLTTDIIAYNKENGTNSNIQDFINEIGVAKARSEENDYVIERANRVIKESTKKYNEYKNDPKKYEEFRTKTLEDKKKIDESLRKEVDETALNEAKTTAINDVERLGALLNTARSKEAKEEIKELLKAAKKNKPRSTKATISTNSVVIEPETNEDGTPGVVEIIDAADIPIEDVIESQEELGINSAEEILEKTVEEQPSISGEDFINVMKSVDAGLTGGVIPKVASALNRDEHERQSFKTSVVSFAYLDKQYEKVYGTTPEGKKYYTIKDKTDEDGNIIINNVTNREHNLPHTYPIGQELVFFVDTKLQGEFGYEANKNNPNTIPIAIQTVEDYKAGRKPVMYMHTIGWLAALDENGQPLMENGMFVPSDKIQPENAQTIIKEHLSMRQHIAENPGAVILGKVKNKKTGALNIPSGKGEQVEHKLMDTFGNDDRVIGLIVTGDASKPIVDDSRRDEIKKLINKGISPYVSTGQPLLIVPSANGEFVPTYLSNNRLKDSSKGAHILDTILEMLYTFVNNPQVMKDLGVNNIKDLETEVRKYVLSLEKDITIATNVEQIFKIYQGSDGNLYVKLRKFEYKRDWDNGGAVTISFPVSTKLTSTFNLTDSFKNNNLSNKRAFSSFFKMLLQDKIATITKDILNPKEFSYIEFKDGKLSRVNKNYYEFLDEYELVYTDLESFPVNGINTYTSQPVIEYEMNYGKIVEFTGEQPEGPVEVDEEEDEESILEGNTNEITEDDKFVLHSFDIFDKILGSEDIGLTGKPIDPTETTLSQQYVNEDIKWSEQMDNVNSLYAQTVATVFRYNKLLEEYNTTATSERKSDIIKELKSLRVKYLIDPKTDKLGKITSTVAFNSVISRLGVLKSIYTKLGKTHFADGTQAILDRVEIKYSEEGGLENFGYRYYVNKMIDTVNYEFALIDGVDANEHKENDVTYDDIFLKANPENSITSEVKMQLSRIKVINYDGQPASTSAGLNKYYTSSHAYNFLVYALSNIPYRYISEEIRTLAARDNAFIMKEVERIYNEMSRKERKQFLKVLKKDTYAYKTLIHNESTFESQRGDEVVEVTTTYHNIKSTNNSGAEGRVLESWEEAFKILGGLNGLLNIDEKGIIQFNKEKRKELEVEFRKVIKEYGAINLQVMPEEVAIKIVSLLDNFGIQITTLEVDTLAKRFMYKVKDKMRTNKGYVPTVNEFLSGTFGYIFTNNDSDLYTKQSGVIKEIASAFVMNNPSIYSSVYRNGNGDNVYGHGNGSFLTSTLNEFKYSETFLQSFRKDNFSKYSWYLALHDATEDKAKILPELFFTDILTEKGVDVEPKAFEEAADADKEYMRLMLSQIHGSKTHSINMMAPGADKTRFACLKLPRVSIVNDVKNKRITFEGDSIITLSKDSDIVSMYFGAVEGELGRINDFAKQLQQFEESTRTGEIVDFDIIHNYHTRSQAGKFFHIFPKLNDILKDYFIKYNNPDSGLYKGELELTEEVRDIIRQHIAEEVSQMMSEKAKGWIEYGLYDKASKTLHYDGRYLKAIAEGVDKMSLDETFLYGVADFTTNSSAALIFDLHFVTGDPALYADTNAGTWEDVVGNNPKSSLVNIFKRTAGNIAPGYQMFNEIEQYRVLTIEEPIFDSLLATASSAIGSKLNKMYSKIKLFDAQELITAEEYFRELVAEGVITDKEADEYLALTADDIIPEKLQKIIIQPRKPVQDGLRWSESLQKNVKTYIKSSSFPLLPALVKGTPLEQLAEFMKSNNVDRLCAPTAFKVGAPIPLKVFKDNKLVDLTTISKELANKSIVTLSRSLYRIQQEIPYDETKYLILEGSQFRKLRFSNLEEGFTFNFNGRKDVTARELKELDDRIHITKYNRKLEKVLDMLGVVKQLNGEYSIQDMTTLKNFILEEAGKRDLGDDMLRMLRTVELNSVTLFDIPLLYHPMSSMIESLLNSIVKNKILKNKIPGHSYVQVSSFGFYNREEGTVSTFKNQSNIIWTKGHDSKRSLDFILGKDEDGRDILEYAEVILPFYFVHNGKRLKLSDYLVDGVLDESKIDPKLLESFGYRIPTSSHSSMVKLKVVGFLPDGVDNTIIVPAAITTQQGSDFDVDKLYVHFNPFNKDENNKLTSVKYSLDTSEEATKARYEEMYGAINTKAQRGLDKEIEIYFDKYFRKDNEFRIDNATEAEDKLLKVLFRENILRDFISEGNVITLEEYRLMKEKYKNIPTYKQFAELPIEEQLTDDQLNTLYLDITDSILKNPMVSKASLDPITDDGLQNAIKYKESLTGKSDEGGYDTTKAISCTGLLNTDHHNHVVRSNAFGKMGVGMFSSLIVNHALFQYGNIHLGQKLDKNGSPMNKDYEILFSDTKNNKSFIHRADTNNTNRVKEGTYSNINSVQRGAWRLDSIYGFDGRKISLVLSNLQNAAVDIAKENYLSPLNINAQTASVAGLLARLGFNENLIGIFLTQPVIYEYVTGLENMFKMLNTEGDDQNIAAYKEKLLKKYGITTPIELNKITNIDVSEMEASLKGEMNEKTLKEFQGRVLVNFLKYNDIAREIGAVQNIINVDTKFLDKNIYSSVLKSLKKDRILLRGDKYFVKNTSNLLNNTIQGRALEIMETMTKIFTKENLIPINIGSDIGNLVSSIMVNAGINLTTTNQDKILEVTNTALKAIRGSVYSKVAMDIYGDKYGKDIIEIRKNLIMGKESLGAIIEGIKAKYVKDTTVKRNAFLDSLFIEKPNVNQEYYSIKFTATNSVKEEATKNNIIGWLELFNSTDPKEVELAEKLLIYSLVFGNERNAVDIGKFIPSDYLFKINFGERIRRYNSEIESTSVDIIRQFFRHNPKLATSITKKDMENINVLNGKKTIHSIKYTVKGEDKESTNIPRWFAFDKTLKTIINKPDLLIEDLNGNKTLPLYYKHYSRLVGGYLLYERVDTKNVNGAVYMLVNTLGDSYNMEYGDTSLPIPSVFKKNLRVNYTKNTPYHLLQRADSVMELPKITNLYNLKANGNPMDVVKSINERSLSTTNKEIANYFMVNFEEDIKDYKIIVDATLKDGMTINYIDKVLKYNPTYNDVLKANYNIDLESETGFEEAILHEISHIVTVERLMNKASQTPEIQNAITNLENLFETLKKDTIFVESLTAEEQLAFTDIKEFVARVFTTKPFRDKLNEKPYGRSSFLEKIFELITKIFGININKDSALAEALENIITIMDKTDNSNIFKQSNKTYTGFQGYKGGFDNKGKGTPEGDGKDKAMREIADGFVIELSSNTPSSSLTSLKNGQILEQKGDKSQTVARSTKNLANEGNVIMLARNGKLSGKPLLQETKDMIKWYYENFDMEFVVGDMPGVDSQFIDYLQEIGAKFTIYHTGNVSRIQLDKSYKPGDQLSLFGLTGSVNLTKDLGTDIKGFMKTLSKEQREILRTEINNGNIKFKCS